MNPQNSQLRQYRRKILKLSKKYRNIIFHNLPQIYLRPLENPKICYPNLAEEFLETPNTYFDIYKKKKRESAKTSGKKIRWTETKSGLNENLQPPKDFLNNKRKLINKQKETDYRTSWNHKSFTPQEPQQMSFQDHKKKGKKKVCRRAES